MEINKQLFEDVLSSKLKGTFVLRNGTKLDSSLLKRNKSFVYSPFERPYGFERNNACTYYDNGLSYIIGAREFDIIDFIPETNMKNELTIEIPEGKIVDWEESKKQNKIVLKDKQLTYRDICRKLFNNEAFYYIKPDGSLGSAFVNGYTPTCGKTEHQLKCILAKNKLANVAVFLNNGWKPTIEEPNWYIVSYKGCHNNRIYVTKEYLGNTYCSSRIIFKTKELAQQAIEILGEETIKLALEPLGI